MIYLDNGATSFPKPDNVIKAACDTIINGAGTPGRGTHEKALLAGNIVEQVRRETARFFGILEDFRVAFTYSATDALNLGIKGFVNKGDKVVMSQMEHNSVSRQLLRMARDKFIDLEIVSCDKKGYLNMDDLNKKVTGNTRLVVLSHASNVTGALQDIETAGSIIRDKGSYLLLDAAQSAGRVDINLKDIPVDMLAFAGHKGLYGLQGTGGLIINDRAENIRPFREGGTGFDSAAEIQPAPWPEAFEAGTQNVVGIVSIGEGIKFIKETGIEKISAAEKKWIEKIRAFLSSYEEITIHSPDSDERSVAILSFTVKGWDAEDIGNILSGNFGVSVRTGLQCAPLAHKCIGTYPAGTVRVSPGYFTKDSDIEKFCEGMRTIAETLVPVY